MTEEKILEEATLEFISNFIKRAKITIDGAEKEFEIQKSVIDGNTISKYVFITTDEGNITKAVLIDAQGRNIRTRTTNIIKGPDGFMIVFVYRLVIEEEMIYEQGQ